ncbi:hypothetical protein D1831_01990 [Lactiplantibacillus garii]|uniref:Uncharacterized protein n=1 Tax=Lactiplantibacillus garii TaxID=2306423 RepID=A0A426D9X1_9LACO|nr:hypothetical protein [Lactiplantibacillus garii]RRK11484.1 hypothetical protein D1831_01990 [Lactiplantibacillus garii]
MTPAPKRHYVIRKKTSRPRTLGRVIMLVALWFFVAFVIVVNLSFIFHVYSDSLVSFYLLLNLDYKLYGIVLGIIALVSLAVGLYAAMRLKKLRGRTHSEEK